MDRKAINKIDVRIIWYFFRRYKLRAFFVFLMISISGLLEMLNLAALYPVINYGLKIKDSNVILRFYNLVINQFPSENPFKISCVLLIFVSSIALLFRVACYYSIYSFMTKVVGDLQKYIFEKLVTAKYSFFTKTRQGELIYTTTSAMEYVSSLIISVLRFSYNFISSLFLLFLLFLLSWKGTLLLLFIGLFYGIFVRKIINKIIHSSAEISAFENRNKNIILNEFINGFKVIRILNVFSYWKRRFINTVDRSLKYQLRMLMGRVYPETSGKLIFYFLLAFVGLFLSNRLESSGFIDSLPLYGTFIAVISRFFPAMQLVGNGFVIIASCIPNARMVYNLCREDVMFEDLGEIALKDFKNEIAYEKVSFKYEGMQDYLLKDISFSIKKNNVTAIVGMSGYGKTTIVNLLLRLYEVSKGEITIDGVNINKIKLDSYLQKIGYVSQDIFIFNDTIKENIRFGLDNCTNEMIEEAAKIANAHEFILETENGYDTKVGDLGIKLSGGQKQRISIARALLRNPEIIVFDEATSSLDNISEKKIQNAIWNISKNTTVLIVAHRLNTVKDADKIIILDKGKIVEQGTNEELLDKKGPYFKLYMSKDTKLI